MTQSTGSYLESMANTIAAYGDKALSSDAIFVIDGWEHMQLLCKQFPSPVLSTGGEIEIPEPNGSMGWQQQQTKTAYQGPVTFHETVKGTAREFFETVIQRGGRFNASVYEGTVEKYTRIDKLKRCFLQIDPADRDWENRAQVLQFSGTLFYRYFGEWVKGNYDPAQTL